MKIAAKRYMAHGLDPRQVLGSAWNARQGGTTLYDWLRTQKFDHPGEVHTLRSLLELGWLVLKRP